MTSDPQSIPELLQQRVNAMPDKPFLFSEADKRQFTYKEFEAAVMRTAGMLAANGLPQPYHPVFHAPRFAMASRDRFFLCLEAADAQFATESATEFLLGLGAVHVTAVRP